MDTAQKRNSTPTPNPNDLDEELQANPSPNQPTNQTLMRWSDGFVWRFRGGVVLRGPGLCARHGRGHGGGSEGEQGRKVRNPNMQSRRETDMAWHGMGKRQAKRSLRFAFGFPVLRLWFAFPFASSLLFLSSFPLRLHECLVQGSPLPQTLCSLSPGWMNIC